MPADPPEVARKLIEAELGRPIAEMFAAFEPSAMASASIGQVHEARLLSGEAVVVKVLHADIEKKVATDMDILGGLALMADMLPEFRNYRPTAMVAEFQRAMRRELDFGREERNIQQFAHDFRDDPTVHIPQTYPRFSSRRVLTMEQLDGIKLSETARLAAVGADTDEIARRGAAICLKMIFDFGFYHADPHPGNLMVMRDGRIGLLDFGMVGRIDERLHEEVSEILVAVSHLDAERTTAMILRLGKTPADLDRSALIARRGRLPLLLCEPIAGEVRPERCAERDDGSDPPLPDHAAGADCHAGQGAGDAGRDRPAGEPEVQPRGNDAALPAEDGAAAVLAPPPAPQVAIGSFRSWTICSTSCRRESPTSSTRCRAGGSTSTSTIAAWNRR